mmetsp:Transcript_16974/g.24941  ORF Transcript_16974/g.24941 Transcript_16974/m.24941 type:complete len:325 (-) Transcript_16974:292-1266(-)|eukprot:CAMPEP_0194073496 /NCGR_PEP_ID=MMETSP0149-20130528/904_1 /TAXON_ID=122233 /ORGANISM="Chaetoceros debilis, Strain MM31A-1" /LENGTH=324 /DNA_ID=CAMNT_0038753523 /DNA_START=89 /DNA_END=1063 /DNA_ORIENTATION=+
MSQMDIPASTFSFSQMEPEASQAPPEARASEKSNLENLGTTKEKVVTDLSRLVLFKAMSGETIDRAKLMKEAFPPESNPTLKDARVINAALNEVTERLKHVIGLDIKTTPNEILENKGMPKKFKERLYVVNSVKDDGVGTHSRELHSVHNESAIEKGLLMLILAFIYCKGEVKDHMRWISAPVLFRLLHSVDENIPAEPASATTITKSGKKRESTSGSGRNSIGAFASPSAAQGASMKFTPNVDEALEKFSQMDYLAKKKLELDGSQTQQDDTIYLYAMGPRAYLEIGRKQVLYYCAQVLEQEPDESMLAELKEDESEHDNDTQ